AQQPQAVVVAGQAGAGEWTCACGAVNTGKFCPECGQPRPETHTCANCGHQVTGNKPKFCAECGKPF
ncbi:MAG: SPFH domain-containing protein, partial [Bacillota bacterium]|nr:SPFH domain-containing protein [Bacillota bacterium]